MSSHVTLPVWLLAIPLILLGTAVKWLAWRELRPTVLLSKQRLGTIYRRLDSRRAGWLAALDAEGIGSHGREETASPLTPLAGPSEYRQTASELQDPAG